MLLPSAALSGGGFNGLEGTREPSASTAAFARFRALTITIAGEVRRVRRDCWRQSPQADGAPDTTANPSRLTCHLMGAVVGALTIARWRVLAVVVGTLWVGAIASGYVFDALVAGRLF
jgi:hypothetical protein